MYSCSSASTLSDPAAVVTTDHNLSQSPDASVSVSACADEHAIKTMKLYSHLERIDNELRARGLLPRDKKQGGGGVALDPETVSKFDSMHYEGDDGMIQAASFASLSSDCAVLDIGSGFGGPARLLAHRTGCSVIALELQEDIHAKAVELTKWCRLEDRVRHVCGDVLAIDLSSYTGSFDAVVSWLVFLHIPDKEALLNKCAGVLKDDGSLFVDDFYALDTNGSFTPEETMSLKKHVFCTDLPTKQFYIASLDRAGFANIEFMDKTSDWTKYVHDRLENFVANRKAFVRLHGDPTYVQLLHFYTAVVTLFEGGHLGGVRICAKRKKRTQE